MSLDPASSEGFPLGYGLFADKGPDTHEAARVCGIEAQRIRDRLDQHARWGLKPNDVEAMRAAAFDLASAILRSIEGHEDPVRAAISASRRKQADAARAEVEKQERVRAAIKKRMLQKAAHG